MVLCAGGLNCKLTKETVIKNHPSPEKKTGVSKFCILKTIIRFAFIIG